MKASEIAKLAKKAEAPAPAPVAAPDSAAQIAARKRTALRPDLGPLFVKAGSNVPVHIPGMCVPDERFRPGYTQFYDPKTGELGPQGDSSEAPVK